MVIKMLKLVSTVGCSICKKAVGILQNKGIEFDKVDVNSDVGKKLQDRVEWFLCLL